MSVNRADEKLYRPRSVFLVLSRLFATDYRSFRTLMLPDLLPERQGTIARLIYWIRSKARMKKRETVN